MNEEEHPPFDAIDFVLVFAALATGWQVAFLVLVVQWPLRRTETARRAMRAISTRATLALEDRFVDGGVGNAIVPSTAKPANGTAQLGRGGQSSSLAPTGPQNGAMASRPAQGDVIDLLSRLIHGLFVGETGGGKTTASHALARHLASTGIQVVYCDPDGIDGRYPGYRVVGAGDDYPAIAKALTILREEVARRREQRKREATRQDGFRPLWFFVDEAHDVVSEVDDAWDVIEDVVRRGRKLNIHIVIGTQDSQVKNLGLEGKSKLLNNLRRVDFRVDEHTGERTVTIGATTYATPPLDNPDDTVVRHTTPLAPKAPPKTPRLPSEEALLTSLLKTPAYGVPMRKDGTPPPSSQAVYRASEETGQAPHAPNDKAAQAPSQDTSEEEIKTAIAARLAAGDSARSIIAHLGEHYGIRNRKRAGDMVKEVREATGGSPTQPPTPTTSWRWIGDDF